jgi:uncharacterized protein (TIGR02996 family)
MTAERDLLDAILADPEDDAPRLVFADWLEENGEARAEFIRLQIERARSALRPDERTPRERQLVEGHGKAWDPDLKALAERCHYERGFVGQVTFRTATTFVRAARRVFELAPVRALEVEAPWFRYAAWSKCPHLTRLRSLKLGRYAPRKWDAKSLRQALAPEGLAGLRELDVNENYYLGPGWGAVLAAASHLASLRVLKLAGNGLEAAGVRSLAKAKHLGQLRALDLCGNDLGLEGARVLARSPLFAGLTDLRLGEEDEFDETNDLGDAGVRALLASPHLTNLETLDLAANGLTDEGAKALAGWPHLASLRWLDLGANDLTDEGVRALASSPGVANLRGLSLYSCDGIGEGGLKALLDSPHLANLVEFSLHDESECKGMWPALQERFGEGLNDFGYWHPPGPRWDADERRGG